MSAPDGKATRRSWAARLQGDRYVLWTLVAVVLVAGVSALLSMPRIEDPRITTRNARVVTPLPGASAARVEAQVTEKVEEALQEVVEIKTLESTSRPGVSVIAIELEDAVTEATNEKVFARIRDRLADVAPRLPPAAGDPEFDDKLGAVASTLITAIRWQGEGDPPVGILGRVADDLADRLRGLAGTEFTRVHGEVEEEFTVVVDPAELAELGLSVSDVAGLVAAADSRGVAGLLRHRDHRLLIEVAGELDSAERVSDVALTRTPGGGVVRLGDVARVEKGWRRPPEAIAYADTARSVFVAARMQADQRVDRWAERARAAVADFAETTDPALGVKVLYDESRYTTDRLATLGGNLLAGAVVVVAVVLVFMGWRSALVVGSALPLSAAAAVFGLTFFGEPLHQMTIFGMIVAIGLLIDNAIVMTDEVRKELRDGHGLAAAIDGAVGKLAVPLSASTLTTILGFMPIFLLPGNVGDFVGPIAVAVILALAASFATALLLIPALAARFAPPGETGGWWREGVAGGGLKRGYGRILRTALDRPGLGVAGVALVCLGGFGAASTLDMEFFPPADRNQFHVELWLPGDAPIARAEAATRAADAVLREHSGVERTTWMVGESTPPVYYNLVQDQDRNPAYAEGIVTTTDAATANALIPRMQDALDARLPGARVVIAALGQGPPIDAPIGVRLHGPDLDVLRRLGEQVRELMQSTPGVTHTAASVTGGEPKLVFRADESAVRRAGLTLDAVAGQMQSALEGRTGGSVLEQLSELPVRVRVADAGRDSLSSVGSLTLTAGEPGARIPLAALGTFDLEPQFSAITRRNGERVNEIHGFVEHGQLPIEVMGAFDERLERAGLALPPGYRLALAGDSEQQQEAVSELTTYAPVLATLMLATVVLSFRSLALAAVIGTVAMLSIGLGMLALALGGYNLGFNPIIGSAGLVGVAVNGTIVVLASIRSNAAGRAGDPDAIVAETLGTSRHILATTLTTIGGFVPLLVFTGGDFWPPLAVVIAGGVGFAVILSMLFTPCAYRLIARRGQREASA
jgi:multidrug efflux pump subunit AcrB